MSDRADKALPLTLTDIEVGARLVEALIQHATSSGGAPIAYENLLTLGRGMYPRHAMLEREVVVGIGMKLAFVEAFCRANAYPNLACLAVNKETMQPGAGCRENWDAERRAVASFDWSAALESLTNYAADAQAAVPKRFKQRKERPADVAWYAYFCSHREACAQLTSEDKKEIINLLMAGLDPDTALGRIMTVKADLGAVS